MSVLNENLLLGAPDTVSSYQIQRSLRFNSSDSAFCSRVPSTLGNRTTWSFSAWVKRSKLGTQQTIFIAGETYASGSGDNYATGLMFGADDKLTSYWRSSTAPLTASPGVYRDVSAWYHVVCVANGSTLKCYVNGIEVSSGAISGNGAVNSTLVHLISAAGTSTYFAYGDLYLADIHFIDGQALTPSSFGQTDANGEWQPIAYTGTYGTNGFKLNFADNSAATAAALGKDTSGNGNNWTPNNLSVTAGAGNDSLVDTPTSYGTDTGVGGEVRGNYCTLNPLAKGAALTLSNGNLDVSDTGATSAPVGSTLSVDSGKWYYEVTLGNGLAYVGISTPSAVNTSVAYLGAVSGQAMYNVGTPSQSWYDGSMYNYSTGAIATTGDIIGVALNCDTGVLTFYKNGVSQGAFGTNILSGRAWQPAFKSNAATSATFNFGQRPFAYTAPSGFKALCDTNLPAPVVAKPSTVMDVKLYTGNGGTQTISGLNFSSDLIWIKSRSNVYDNVIQDSVRGITSKYLITNSTAAEADGSGFQVTAVTDTSFSVGAGTGYNTNAATYAAWCWDAGSSNVVNTQGTITSTVRANPSAGFSVVTYTGNLTGSGTSTVGHGLNVPPQMIIFKRRDGVSDWPVQHSGLPSANNLLYLNLTNATATSGFGTIVAPTSSVFTVAWLTGMGVSGQTHVAYCFAPVAGYSSFGSYTGNGSADGPFVYTGFRPRWLLIKNTTGGTATDAWLIYDAARDTYNVASKYLYANSSNAEATYGIPDFCSNGFKLRQSSGESNASAGTYIYAAFAENPFQYARAR